MLPKEDEKIVLENRAKEKLHILNKMPTNTNQKERG